MFFVSHCIAVEATLNWLENCIRTFRLIVSFFTSSLAQIFQWKQQYISIWDWIIAVQRGCIENPTDFVPSDNFYKWQREEMATPLNQYYVLNTFLYKCKYSNCVSEFVNRISSVCSSPKKKHTRCIAHVERTICNKRGRGKSRRIRTKRTEKNTGINETIFSLNTNIYVIKCENHFVPHLRMSACAC